MDRRRQTFRAGQTLVLAAALIATGGAVAHVLVPACPSLPCSGTPGSHDRPPALLDLPRDVAPLWLAPVAAHDSVTAPIEQTAATLTETSADLQRRLQQHALYGGYPPSPDGRQR